MAELVRTDFEDADFRALVGLLDEELGRRDGEQHAFFSQFNKLGSLLGVVVASVNSEAVGCGAFKRFSDTEAEVKRMFVSPDHRGKRIAASVLKELETWAAESGFTAGVLETGYKQPEAIALYKRAGYSEIANYGQYADVAASLCMRKNLSKI